MAQGQGDLLYRHGLFPHGSRGQALPDAVYLFCVFFGGNLGGLLPFDIVADDLMEAVT